MKKIVIFFCFLLLTKSMYADEWRIMPGKARDIAVGANGKVWVVGNIAREGGYSIHGWNGTVWEEIDGSAVRIAADPAGIPWVINNRNQIFRREGNRWVQITGNASDIGIGTDGTVWIIGTATGTGGNNIFSWTGTSWRPVNGSGTRIAVGPNGQPFIVSTSGAIQERLPDGTWRNYILSAKDISVGANGSVWIIGGTAKSGSYSIYKLDADRWEEVDGGGTQIAVDPAGMPLITNHLFEIYRRTFTPPVYGSVFTTTAVTHDYPYSGKIESIAVDPTNNNHIMVASCGGIFETFRANSAVRSWETNTDFVSPHALDVLFSGIPAYNIAWAAVGEEFTSSTLPQIWEKSKSGKWARAEFTPVTRVNSDKTSAYRIINGVTRGSYFACGDFGIASFDISGLWHLMANNLSTPVYSIAILKNGTIAAGTEAGIYVYSTTQNRWNLVNTSIRFESGSQRYQLNTDFTGRIFLAADLFGGTGIHYSMEGTNWNRFPGPPAYLEAAGGFTSVYLDSLVTGKYSLLVSNKYKFYQADILGTNPVTAISTLQPSSAIAWSEPIQPGHDDTRHFLKLTSADRSAKIIMTSDGGFHISTINYATPATYSWETEKPTSGLKNLEVYNLTGTSTVTNFGTQHNGFGALDASFNLLGSGLNEGYVISRRGIGTTDPRVIVFAPDKRLPTGLSIQGPAFGTSAFRVCSTPDPLWVGPNNGWGNPIWFGNRIYIQDAAPTAGSSGIFPWKISRDNGCTWQNLPDGNAVRIGMNAFFSIGNDFQHNLFIALRGRGGVGLGRLINPSSTSAARWEYPSMNGMEGGIAVNGADFLYNPVFSVNPANPNHMLALEKNTGKLKESTNGGNNWTDAVSFNRELTGTHSFLLKSNKGGFNIRCITFSPYDPRLILIGTASAGCYISTNGGISWKRINRSGLMNVSDFHWRSPRSVMISTYAHGVFVMTL